MAREHKASSEIEIDLKKQIDAYIKSSNYDLEWKSIHDDQILNITIQ